MNSLIELLAMTRHEGEVVVGCTTPEGPNQVQSFWAPCISVNLLEALYLGQRP